MAHDSSTDNEIEYLEALLSQTQVTLTQPDFDKFTNLLERFPHEERVINFASRILGLGLSLEVFGFHRIRNWLHGLEICSNNMTVLSMGCEVISGRSEDKSDAIILEECGAAQILCKGLEVFIDESKTISFVISGLCNLLIVEKFQASFF